MRPYREQMRACLKIWGKGECSGSQFMLWMNSLIAELPEKQYEVVTMAFEDKLTIEEIAESTGLKRTGVNGRLAAAYDNLWNVSRETVLIGE